MLQQYNLTLLLKSFTCLRHEEFSLRPRDFTVYGVIEPFHLGCDPAGSDLNITAAGVRKTVIMCGCSQVERFAVLCKITKEKRCRVLKERIYCVT